MDDNTPILTKVNDNILLGNKAIALNDPVVQNQLEQIMQQNIIQNVYKPPKTDFIIKNPNEKSEELLEKVVDNQEKQSSTLHSIHYEDTKTNSQFTVLLKLLDKQNTDIENLQNINKELKNTNKTLEESNKHSLRNGILLGLIPLVIEWITKIIIHLLQYLEVIPK